MANPAPAGRGFGFGRLGQNTVLFTSGLGLRALVQMLYLFLLTRWMGPDGYGYFAGSVAAAIILSPLAGWGVSFLVASRVGHDKTSAARLWATALAQVLFSAALLIGLLMLASVLLLEQRVTLVAMLALAISELVALPIANAAVGVALAAERGWLTTLATCLVPLGRLAMVTLLLLSGGGLTPEAVAGMHMLGSVAGAGLAFVLLGRVGCWPDWRNRIRVAPATREGLSHAFGALVGMSYLEIDKVIMLQLLDASTAGTYTLAFRAAVLLTLPVAALVAVVLPRTFAVAGTAGEAPLRRAVSWSLAAYSLAAAAVAVLASPLLSVVFGAGFAGSGAYLAMLAPWIPAYALHQYLATRLTTSGRQARRVGIESAGFLGLVLLNLWLVPRIGPPGAVASLLTAEAFMIAALAWALAAGGRRA